MTPEVKHGMKEGGLALLRLTHDSADAFPPLKSVVGGALNIINLVAVSKYLSIFHFTPRLMVWPRNSNPPRKTG